MSEVSSYGFRRAFQAMLVVVCLAGCSPENGAGAGKAETFSVAQPKALRLEIVATPLQNGARISGQTNLPDGTRLMLGLQRGPVVGGPEAVVSDGAFSADVFPRRGAPIPPGRYEVSVSTPLGDLQPDNVKNQLGSNYEALTGPLLRRDDLGRIIQYRGSVTIGGRANAAADREARRKAGREYGAYTDRSCQSHPDTVERLSGQRMTSAQRARSIQECRREMEQGRRELAREGLIER